MLQVTGRLLYNFVYKGLRVIKSAKFVLDAFFPSVVDDLGQLFWACGRTVEGKVNLVLYFVSHIVQSSPVDREDKRS